MAYMTTDVFIDCPCCGAAGVPVAWGKGKLGEMYMYTHVEGVKFRRNPKGGRKCYGVEDVFKYMLSEHRLALTGRGKRLPTTAEKTARKKANA